MLENYYNSNKKDDIPKNKNLNNRFKLLHANVNQSLYAMKLKNFLDMDTNKRIKLFEEFFKQVKI